MKKLFALVALVLMVLMVLINQWSKLPGTRFYKSYQRIQIGMTKEAVQGLFEGRPPIGRWGFRGFSIWYFERPGGSLVSKTLPGVGSETPIEFLSELPDRYASVQIAFDADDKVWAYSWIGETYTVVYKGGEVNGSNIALVEAQMRNSMRERQE